LWQNTVCGSIGLPRLIGLRLSLPMDSVFVKRHPDHGLMGCYRARSQCPFFEFIDKFWRGF
jgi:hypothetical protein